jgi:cleavage and polyadenylation specificity factor subunit 3
MGRLRAAMTSRYKDRDEDVKIHTPRNLETLNLSFRGERVAKVEWIALRHSALNIPLLGHRVASHTNAPTK